MFKAKKAPLRQKAEKVRRTYEGNYVVVVQGSSFDADPVEFLDNGYVAVKCRKTKKVYVAKADWLQE